MVSKICYYIITILIPIYMYICTYVTHSILEYYYTQYLTHTPLYFSFTHNTSLTRRYISLQKLRDNPSHHLIIIITFFNNFYIHVMLSGNEEIPWSLRRWTSATMKFLIFVHRRMFFNEFQWIALPRRTDLRRNPWKTSKI